MQEEGLVTWLDRSTDRIEGVVIGRMYGVDPQGRALVDFVGNRADGAIPVTRALCALTQEDRGAEVALLFEDGSPARPVVMGKVVALAAAPVPKPLDSKETSPHMTEPATTTRSTASPALHLSVDGKRVTLQGDEEIVLKCGRASITLTAEGKILLRGAYVLSRSTGVNRIKGGSVQIN